MYIVHGTIFGQKEMMSRSSNIGGELAPIFIESDCIWYIAMRRLLSYEGSPANIFDSCIERISLELNVALGVQPRRAKFKGILIRSSVGPKN